MEENTDVPITFEFLKMINSCAGCGKGFTQLQTLRCCFRSFCPTCLTDNPSTDNLQSGPFQPEVPASCPGCGSDVTAADTFTKHLFLSKLRRVGLISAPLSLHRFCEKPNCAGNESRDIVGVNSEPNETYQPDKSATVYCHQCAQLLCAVCCDRHKTWFDKQHTFTTLLNEDCLTDDVIREVVTTSEAPCRECSEGPEVAVTCQTCSGISVCYKCALKKHRTHDFNDIKDCADISRTVLFDNRKVISECSRKISVALSDEFDTYRKEFVEQKQKMTQVAEDRIAKIREECEGEIHNLEKVYNEQVREMDSVKAEASKVSASIKGLSAYIYSLVKVGSNFDLIDHDAECSNQTKVLIARTDSVLQSLSVAALNNRCCWYLHQPSSTSSEDPGNLCESGDSEESENFRDDLRSSVDCSPTSRDNSEQNPGLLTRLSGRVRNRFGSAQSNTSDNIELHSSRGNLEMDLKSLKTAYGKLIIKYDDERAKRDTFEKQLKDVIMRNTELQKRLYEQGRVIETLKSDYAGLQDQEARARNELDVLRCRNELCRKGFSVLDPNDTTPICQIVPSASLNQ